ncbi:MAG: C4-dicarboxylate-binding periplasmic protein precursor [Syntrophorhabdus sp. PtaU1.Bin058]|nr:MAG: C4-dicarboxylate-binding periplasmic protein precursor [Syntrophorhabdus sp. PtaU1.Bin058]
MKGRRKAYGVLTLGVKSLVIGLLIIGLSGLPATGAPKSTLSFSSWDSEKSAAAPAINQMVKDIEEGTGGAVAVKIHYAEALGKAKEHYEIALKGLADISYINVGFTPGRFPITDMVAFAQGPSAEALTKGLVEVMKKGYLQKEYQNVKLLFVWSGSPCHILWRKGVKAATSIEELKGKKIRVANVAGANLMKKLGAVPVAIPMPEVYTAMERGVIDGTFTSIDVLEVFSLYSVCNEVTRIGALSLSFCVIMNKGSWDKLPANAKAIFDKNGEKWGMLAGSSFDQLGKRTIEKYKPKIYDMQPGDLQKIKDAMAEPVKQYLDKYAAQGYPIKEAAKTYSETLKKYYNTEPFVLPK